MTAKSMKLVPFVCLCAIYSAGALAAPMGRFVDLKPVPGLDRPDRNTAGIAVTQDGLTAFWGSIQDASAPNDMPTPSSLFVASRSNPREAFGSPVKLGPHINLEGALNESPHITADGLRLYWSSPPLVTDPLTLTNIYMATRNSPLDEFSDRVSLAELNTDENWEYSPSLSADELTIVFDKGAFDRAFNIRFRDLYMASRASPSDPFGPPQPIAALNTPAEEAHPSLSSDGLTLFYARHVGIPNNSPDIWVATRESTTEPFGNPLPLEELFFGSEINAPDSATWEPFISADWPAHGSKLYFTRTTLADTSDWDFYEATWVPEPTALVLAIVGLAICMYATDRKRSANQFLSLKRRALKDR